VTQSRGSPSTVNHYSQHQAPTTHHWLPPPRHISTTTPEAGPQSITPLSPRRDSPRVLKFSAFSFQYPKQKSRVEETWDRQWSSNTVRRAPAPSAAPIRRRSGAKIGANASPPLPCCSATPAVCCTTSAGCPAASQRLIVSDRRRRILDQERVNYRRDEGGDSCRHEAKTQKRRNARRAR